MSKYFSADFIIKQGWANMAQLNRVGSEGINIQFCKDCEYFERNYWQPDPDITHGWCGRVSYTLTYDDEAPYYVCVTSNDFCNKEAVDNG